MYIYNFTEICNEFEFIHIVSVKGKPLSKCRVVQYLALLGGLVVFSRTRPQTMRTHFTALQKFLRIANTFTKELNIEPAKTTTLLKRYLDQNSSQMPNAKENRDE
jgi:hypothetical protein